MDTQGQGNSYREFSEVLQSLEMPRKAIAIELGVPYSTYDNWVRGEISFPSKYLVRLYEITQDNRILDYFLKPLGFQYTPDPNGNYKIQESWRDMLLSLSIRFGNLMRITRDTWKDQVETVRELNLIKDEGNGIIWDLQKFIVFHIRKVSSS